MKLIPFITATAIISILMISCTKYQEIGDASFSGQQVYMPAAVDGISTNGIYSINKVAVPGQVFRYTADVAGKKLNIPLGVYRSGANTKGAVNVTVAVNVDTAAKMLAAGKFPAGTEVLLTGKYNVPTTVTIANAADYASFSLSIDFDFLLANTTKKYAIGVTISSTDRTISRYGTTILLINPAFLVLTAAFTTAISSRTVNFSNTSLNGATYTWDYGDGTPPSTGVALPHTYAAAGTYSIRLTATGALGDYNKATYTATIVIP